MDLFAPDPETTPLADRMRPRNFDEVLGQDHLVARGAPFRAAIESGRPPSALLWGPPGVGKTTIARLVAEAAGLRFVPFSAVLSGIKEIRDVMKEAQASRKIGRRTLVFVDEIHRFNKAQQDAFLPYVEAGDIVLLGATTENPSFEVIPALLSRMAVHVLKPLGPEHTVTLLERALDDDARGLKKLGLSLETGVIDDLAAFADGDGRKALNALEAVARNAASEGQARLVRADLKRVLEKQLLYDKSGEQHYDVISAFIKSVRNSDPDAAIYWLARMLEAGEDPIFVARRLVVLASEDIGLADPRALPLAVAAFQGTHLIGLPEAKFLLSEATLYLALAAKSNSSKTSYANAVKDIQERPNEPVPMHLRNAVTGLMGRLGYGAGYRYAHDDAGAGEMSCLPAGLAGRRYYEPGANGAEPALKRSEAKAAVGRKQEKQA